MTPLVSSQLDMHSLPITGLKVRLRIVVLACALALIGPSGAVGATADMAFVDAEVAVRAGQSGVYVLDSGEEALLARAWLADQARESIEVQYFIWSTDNIGILAAEALLRAADRGVRVRVIVDDLLIDAPDKSLLALAKHPRIDIRIYNPKTSVGVPLLTRLLNVVLGFRDVNQRMHDKTVVVDGRVAITGGRNMAAEYFDYNHSYNFRDRDVLLLGAVVADVRASFERFWSSGLAVPVEALYDGLGLMQKHVVVQDEDVQQVYTDLRDYARLPSNFAPEVRAAIAATPTAFPRIARHVAWGRVEFISDRPGKNDSRVSLAGGGETTRRLAALVDAAQESIIIQSPYLVLSDAAIELFKRARARGVRVAVSTNSMASTDNLPAFSGYRSQRQRLLAMGIEIFEYRPDAAVQRASMRPYLAAATKPPIFSMHAKSLVVDSIVAFVGTFNLDPRSENLNTEVGVVIFDPLVAKAVEASILADMAPGSSWSAASDNPDQYAPLSKRAKVRLLELLPLRQLL
ncbi:MAG TPA: phospholipase D family protein [Steroidobacteraceae bacterium]|nr:phospholipase D family protein [Steroidobacteraceae bacterium]